MGEETKREVDCPLCDLVFDDDVKTQVHRKGEHWYVVDCLTCGTPMAVLCSHEQVVTVEALCELMVILYWKFPGKSLRTQMRKIPEHLHFHIVE